MLKDQRDGGGEGKDQDQRAFELPQKQSQRVQKRGILDAVGAHSHKLRGRSIGWKAVRSAAQTRRHGVGVLIPVARVTRRIGHRGPHESGAGYAGTSASSDNGSEHCADPGRQRHRESAPECDAQGGFHHIGTTRPGANGTEESKEQK